MNYKKMILAILCMGNVGLSLMAMEGQKLEEDKRALKQEAFEAGREGNLATVKAVLAKGAALNMTPVLLDGALFGAIFDGHEDLAKALIDEDADVNSRSAGPHFEKTPTPLALAANNGFASICRLLINNGADVTILDSVHESPIYRAIDSFNEDTVVAVLAALPPAEREKILKMKHDILHKQFLVKQLPLPPKDVRSILQKMFTVSMINDLVAEQMQRIKVFIDAEYVHNIDKNLILKGPSPFTYAEGQRKPFQPVLRLLNLHNPASYERVRRQVRNYIMYLLFGPPVEQARPMGVVEVCPEEGVIPMDIGD